MKSIAVLLRYGWRRHRLPLLPMIGALMLFEFLITRVAPAPNEVGWIGNLLAAIPPKLLELAGSDIAFTTRGFLSLGYGHPFVLILLSLWIVRASSGAVAGEIGRGTMDLLAVRPIRRSELLVGGYLTLAAGLVLLTSAAWAGTAIGVATRPMGETARPFVALAAMLALLFLTWGAVGMLVGALRHDAGGAIAWTSALVAASFVLDYLARLWKPLASLRPLSLFAYYRPQTIAVSGVSLRDVATLTAVMVVSLVAAQIALSRRDL